MNMKCFQCGTRTIDGRYPEGACPDAVAGDKTHVMHPSVATERDTWWHCDFCGDHCPADEPYTIGDLEPCSACGEGTSRVMSLKDAARLESAIARGEARPRRAYT